MPALLTPWTEERIKALRDYAELRMSSSEIANQLGGTTRSAVIGKMSRLGIESRYPCGFQKSAVKRTYRPRKSNVFSTQWGGTSEIKPPRHVYAEIAAAVPTHVGLLDLGPGMCRWPYGNGPYTFCGCSARESYCDAHAVQSVRGTYSATEIAA